MPQAFPSHNLPVYTVSGRHLGRVVEVEFEAGGAVRYYHVKPPFHFRNLWRRRLLIAPSQVVSLTSERMVVEEPTPRVPAAAPGIVPEPTS